MNSRILWVDWIKVIGIYIIVLGHIPLESSWLTAFIFSFHVPIFFIISGYLYKASTTAKVSWKKNIHALLFPYLSISFIIILYNLLTFSLHNPFSLLNIIIILTKQISAILLGLNNCNWETIEGVGGPIWYIYVLFFIRLLFDTIEKRSIHIMLCILFIITSYLLNSFNINCPFSILNILLAYPFFIIGYNIRNYYYEIFERIRLFLTKHPISNFCIMITSCFITYYISHFNGVAYMYIHSFGNNILLFYTAAFSGSIWLFSLCQYISSFKINLIERLSNGTMLILGLHIILINYSIRFINLSSIPQTLLLALICTLIFYHPIIIVSKYCPFILGKKIKMQ